MSQKTKRRPPSSVVTPEVKELSAKILAIQEEDAKSAQKIAKILQNCQSEEIVEAVLNRLHVTTKGDGSSYSALLTKVLSGCRIETQSPETKNTLRTIRNKVISVSLKEVMHSEFIPNKLAEEIIQVLLQDLGNSRETYSTPDLLKLLHLCHQEIHSNNTEMTDRWMNFFTKVIGCIHSRETVVIPQGFDLDCDEMGPEEEMSGPEFRKIYLRFMCSNAPLPPSRLTSYCSFIRDVSENVPLTEEEYTLASEKMCSVMQKVSPDEVPPFVYQMLLLSKTHSASTLLNALTKYFAKKNEFQDEVDSQSQTDSVDCADTDRYQRNLMQNEYTVMHHLTQAVRMFSHPLEKDVIKLVKFGTQVSELILEPFTLYLILSLSSVKKHHQVIVDSLKSTLIRSLTLDMKRKRDAWVKDMTPEIRNPSKLFKSLIGQANRFGGWDLIGKGILDLAISLLDLNPPLGGKPDEKTKLAWGLGTDIIIMIIKRSRYSVPGVVDMISKRVMSSRASVQYTECLRLLVKESLPFVMEKPSLFNDLMIQVCFLGVHGARRVIGALVPVIKFSRSLKDVAIITMSKALSSRNIETKQIAIEGALHLMKVFRISSALPVTQMSQHSSASFSQLSSQVRQGVVTSNDSLCTELLGVIKRGLSLGAPVRSAVYSGLYEAVSVNPEMCIPALEVLEEHAKGQKWLIKQENGANESENYAIEMDATFKENDNGVYEVQEPVGWYLNCVQQLIFKADQLYGDDDDSQEENFGSKERLNGILEKLSNKYAESDIVLDFNIQKNADYSKNSLEGEKNLAKIENVKNIFEALMEFVILHGGVDVDLDKAKLLINLFERHQEVVGLVKNAGTKGASTKKNEKAKGDETLKSVGKKARPQAKATFSIPTIAMTVRALSVALRALLIDQDTRHDEAREFLLSHSDFVTFLLHCVQSKQSQLEKEISGSEGLYVKSNHVMTKHLTSIGEILAQHVLLEDSGGVSLELASEIFIQNVQIAFGLISDSDEYLGKLCKVVSTEEESSKCAGLGKCAMRKLKSLEDKDEDTQNVKLTANILRFLLAIMHHAISTNDEDTSTDFMQEVYSWLSDLGESSKSVLRHAETLEPYLRIRFAVHRALKTNLTFPGELAKALHAKVGDMDESTETLAYGNFTFLTEELGDTCFRLLSEDFDASLDDVDQMITRCKQILASESVGFALLKSSGNTKHLSDWEIGLSFYLCRIVNAMEELTQSDFKLESLVDQLPRISIRLYTSLSNLAKYYLVRVKTFKDAVAASNFDKLVQNVGKGLTSKIYALFNHIEKRERDILDDSDLKSSTKASVNSRIAKQSKIMPNLVFRLEQFETDVIKLEVKSKLNLMGTTKISTSRDFRLIMDKIVDQSSQDSATTINSQPNAESTRMDVDDEAEDDEVENNPSSLNSTQSTQPPNKKLKVKMNFHKSKV